MAQARRRPKLMRTCWSARTRLIAAARTLEAFALQGGNWVLVAALKDDDALRMPPFEAISFPLSALWPEWPAVPRQPPTLAERAGRASHPGDQDVDRTGDLVALRRGASQPGPARMSASGWPCASCHAAWAAKAAAFSSRQRRRCASAAGFIDGIRTDDTARLYRSRRGVEFRRGIAPRGGPSPFPGYRRAGGEGRVDVFSKPNSTQMTP